MIASMSSSEPIPTGRRLEAIEVTKQYASVRVLKGVNCTLRPGRIHAVIGENGAGKSTLFKILSGLVEPSSGLLKLNGPTADVGLAEGRPSPWNLPGAAGAGADRRAHRRRDDVRRTSEQGPRAVPSPRLGGSSARRPAAARRLRVGAFVYA
jgi:energy-coupling factor transporter ATP-binding protein EcfA2